MRFPSYRFIAFRFANDITKLLARESELLICVIYILDNLVAARVLIAIV